MKDKMELYKRLADYCSCGLCGGESARDSEYTCFSCGRILCEDCGRWWGCCKDHPRTCCGEQVIGSTQHNYICGKCKNGVGSLPDPYDTWRENERQDN